MNHTDNQFTLASSYETIWKSIDDRAKTAASNALGRDQAAKAVEESWKDASKALLKLKQAQGYTDRHGDINLEFLQLPHLSDAYRQLI